MVQLFWRRKGAGFGARKPFPWGAAVSWKKGAVSEQKACLSLGCCCPALLEQESLPFLYHLSFLVRTTPLSQFLLFKHLSAAAAAPARASRRRSAATRPAGTRLHAGAAASAAPPSRFRSRFNRDEKRVSANSQRRECRWYRFLPHSPLTLAVVSMEMDRGCQKIHSARICVYAGEDGANGSLRACGG